MTDYKHFTVDKESEIVERIEAQEGSNDEERLRNWAENYSSEEEDSEFTEEEIRSIAREEAEDKIYELQRSR